MNTVAETITAMQDHVNQALLNSNWTTLEELVAPDARIVGPRGFLIGRDEWIAVHARGDYEQGRLDVSETDVQAFDNAGVRVDVVDSECTYQGEKITGRFRVLQAWATRAGRWQLIGLQYTGIAEPAVAC